MHSPSLLVVLHAASYSKIACEAYRDEMGLFLRCRESGRRQYMA